MKIAGYGVSFTSGGVTVGCTFVSRATVEKVLANIKKAKPCPRVGTKVKVVRRISTSGAVFRKTGLVVRSNDKSLLLVRLPGWDGGHSGEGLDSSVDKWFVDPRAVKAVRE